MGNYFRSPKNSKYPKNPDMCMNCRYRTRINTGKRMNYGKDDISMYYCNYLTITGHRRPKDETDTYEHCSCFEEAKG